MVKVEPYAADIPLQGPEAPPFPDRIDDLIKYLVTISERFGNTAVSFRLRWGAAALWSHDVPQGIDALLRPDGADGVQTVTIELDGDGMYLITSSRLGTWFKGISLEEAVYKAVRNEVST